MWPLDPMLRFAAKNGLTTLAEISLYFGADVNSKTYFDRSRDSVLMLAVKSKNKEMLDLILGEKNLKINEENASGLTALLTAFKVKEGKDNYAINAIISKGADVNHVSKINGLTPLTYAVSIGDADMTKNLLQNGAKIDLEDNFGCTPLQMVEDIAKSNPDIIRIFAEYCTPENEKWPPNTKTRSRGVSV